MILYALTILVSAFLLFQVQPVIAKIILPWFGGSAAVWTTCLLFFQMVLLLGYMYSHAVIRYLKPRAQMLLHAGLLVVSVLALPIYPNASWKPSGAGAEPTLQILGLLAVTIGLPYFLLSTTGPLLQAWYARRFHGAMPYRLYALSNAGSMFALISYPALFEPSFTTRQQSGMWSWSYGLFVVLCAFTAFKSNRAVATTLQQPEADIVPVADIPPVAKTYLMWLLLPAVASVLLLAITNHLSQNVAAIPFLWVLPLSIYLLSFILCFEGEGWYRRNPYLQLLAVALGSMAYAVSVDITSNVPIKVMVSLFAMGLFTCRRGTGWVAGRPPGPAFPECTVRNAGEPRRLRGFGRLRAPSRRRTEVDTAMARRRRERRVDAGTGGICWVASQTDGKWIPRISTQFLRRIESQGYRRQGLVGRNPHADPRHH
ncbi:MAG: hypothetical protein NTW28_18510 [Candidatus Solibacter sp.]|nr:hypothetical protein [Candidatus Solibacter sp.]